MVKINITALLLFIAVGTHTSAASVFRGLQQFNPEAPTIQQGDERALFGDDTPVSTQKPDYSIGHASANGSNSHNTDHYADSYHHHHHRALLDGSGNDQPAPPQTPAFENSQSGAGAPIDHLGDFPRLDEAENVLITSESTSEGSSRQLKAAVVVRCWRDMGTLMCMM